MSSASKAGACKGQAANRRWEDGRSVRAGKGKGKRIGLAPFLASALVLLAASCGIPSYPFLAPPLAPTATPANYTFTFTNNPDTSPIFDGFILMYRLYADAADIAADISALGTLDPEQNGLATLRKLESLGYSRIQSDLSVDDLAEFMVTVSFNEEPTTASAPGYLYQTLYRENGKGFDDISSTDDDLKNSETPDTVYSVALYVCSRGLDIELGASFVTYYSQFVQLGSFQMRTPVSE